jgi:hypothetical protein
VRLLPRIARLTAAAAILAVMASATFIQPSTHAYPTASSQGPRYTYTVHFGSSTYKLAQLVAKMKKQTKGRTLDYRVAKKVFGKGDTRVKWRRQVAAGWWDAGGKLSHISKAERRKVDAFRDRVGQSQLYALQAACTGRSGHERLDPTKEDYFNRNYYNSCQVNIIKRNFSICGLAAGAVGVIFRNPGVTAMMALVGFVCGGTSAWLAAAQENSDVLAVIVMTGGIQKETPRPPGSPVRYQIPVKVVPQ